MRFMFLLKGLPRLPAAGVLAVFFLSCQSVGPDLRIDTMDAARRGDLAELEELIVPLDRSSGEGRDALIRARNRIAELEKNPSADTEYAGALAAWSGRLHLLEGRTGDAARKLKESQSLSPGNTQSLILALRLEADPQKRLALIDQELRIAGPAGGSGLSAEASSPIAALHIERGRTLMELHRYGEAAGAFDTAFVGSLPRVYGETYGESRALAWELRDTQPETRSGIMTIMAQETGHWGDLIELTKAETDLLRFLTAGRDLPASELFKRLVERSFIPAAQDISLNEWPAANPRMEDQVLRSGAAWFLWRLYAENRADRGLLSRYSSRYAGRTNAQSPIADLPLLSPFFDAILGCVETEIMALPDGRNFIPAGPIRPSVFLGMLRKIR
jgi:hypothetical protein